MKKLFLIVAALFVAVSFSSCNKDEDTWTDDNPIIEFKDPCFLSALLSPQNDVDRNKDGKISKKEAANCAEINVDDSEIRGMDEIRYFTALTKLYCVYNHLTSLDLSKNTALTELDCDQNQLTSLDLSKNTALTELVCHINQLTSLDLSKNTALTELDFHENQLTSLDLSKNTALTYLGCNENQLTSLDLSKNTALKWLECKSCPNLKTIILYRYHHIFDFYIYTIIEEYGDIITYVE